MYRAAQPGRPDVAPRICADFLYGFKAAPTGPLAPPARGGSAVLPLPLPLGRPLTPGRLARKAKAGPLKPEEVTELRRI